MNAHCSEDVLIDLATGVRHRRGAVEPLSHLEHCAVCEERFRELCGEVERLRLPSASWLSRSALAAAAAAVLLATMFAWQATRRSPGNPLEYWLPLEAEATESRSVGEDAAPAVFAEAAAAYARHDPARVVALLQDRTFPESQEPMKLVLASALLKTARHEDARRLLEELSIPTLPQPYRDRARWLLVAALLAAHEQEKAAEVARDLASRPGEFSEAAREVFPDL